MTILVTGCSGYIASFLIPALKERGHTTLGVDRVSYGGEDLDEFRQADLVEDNSLSGMVNQADAILHLAAAKGDWGISEEEYYRDNLGVTRNVIEAGVEAGVKDWIFYSTVSTLGPHREAVGEEADFNPINPYGASKAEAEKLFQQLANEYPGNRVLTIRPSVVYGSNNPPSTNIYRLVDAIYNRRFAMVGPGDALKSTSYIENLLEATLFLMERMEQGLQTYIYVDNPVLTTGTLVERIYRLRGKAPPSWHIPLSIASPIATVSDWTADLTGIDFPITAARIEKFNRSTNFDASKIREEGFEQPVSNEEALRKTVEWHLQHKYDETL
ncbi:NAD-dependent epimerase/dehydratase family protein [Salinibacter ruber]|uniref:NAD-dependent epimerase/dehydratase family protein n=1 Tax=Salinibacter ruber TaxID=146919 RepID=UPI002167B3AE|nr:NAD-dependent epimerase/dehydratase family protein [Salinibacter ruber]MCS3655580.1 nucleoside-diphosphate-sugar epimerase [Salinibacter ruber]MCS4116738.1 nucleoside-diphosphate-sugar epimerase [Salinibacter ruber]MCS4152843.1 nucleoside-diphosphate-sugar epimerase [Salinibacter ruber]MCS4168656.1 nucleoside-diphosphate-sugar epimerase [Salinibacter ruber]MCS4185428.1 nucleoside-diphosphate-sugar epimerase [Salinibacter ruber]